jgi:hypothetical protein
MLRKNPMLGYADADAVQARIGKELLEYLENIQSGITKI